MGEYQRLDGELPDELQKLISEYAQPVYKRPEHFKHISELFSNLKEYSISWIVYKNESDIDETDEMVKVLRNKQLGVICEEEDIDITVTCFTDYLVVKDILQPNRWL